MNVRGHVASKRCCGRHVAASLSGVRERWAPGRRSPGLPSGRFLPLRERRFRWSGTCRSLRRMRGYQRTGWRPMNCHWMSCRWMTTGWSSRSLRRWTHFPQTTPLRSRPRSTSRRPAPPRWRLFGMGSCSSLSLLGRCSCAAGPDRFRVPLPTVRSTHQRRLGCCLEIAPTLSGDDSERTPSFSSAWVEAADPAFAR